jgi:hypothetical protein
VDIGFSSADTSRGNGAVAIGLLAGEINQGSTVENSNQGQNAVAVGHVSGSSSQG